ncbi:MAG: hypothetical protein R3C24_09495 [Cyanobacteriota/Melainabacteria group bacterium]
MHRIKRSPGKILIPAGSVLLAMSCALLINAPVAFGGDLAKSSTSRTSVSRAKSKSLSAPRKITPEAPPEAGVKLLMGILKRIGNAPQIAMQQARENRLRADSVQAQSNQIFNQNLGGANPALTIRPRGTGYAASSKAKTEATAGKLIASSRGGARFAFASNTYSDSAGSKNIRTYPRGISNESQKQLKESAKKLYDLTSVISGISNTAAGQPMAEEEASAASEDKLVRASAPRGRVIAQSPKIVDYSKGAGFSPSGLVPTLQGATNGTIMGGASDAVEKKLDQPAAYRHMREYGKRLPSQEPADDLEQGDADNFYKSGDNHLASSFGRRQEIGHLAYMPPNTISGVPGLRLGASKVQVESFLSAATAKKGEVLHSQVNGWDVWVLKNGGKASLQVYMRNNIVEAFRIFDSKYVPERLKITLDTPLETMKEKFGEPAFILMEPDVGAGSMHKRGVKNYVYPVSQVSFQLARVNEKSKSSLGQIRIKSMLLFKFL